MMMMMIIIVVILAPHDTFGYFEAACYVLLKWLRLERQGKGMSYQYRTSCGL